jgi:hypothetical protein
VAVPTLLYGCEMWTVKMTFSNLQASEMKFPQAVKGCIEEDQVRNDIRQELQIFSNRKMVESGEQWLAHVESLEGGCPQRYFEYGLENS